MPTQAEVLASLDADAKVAGKALLLALSQDGHALDLEADVLAEKLGSFGPSVMALVKPFLKQIVQSVAAKM